MLAPAPRPLRRPRVWAVPRRPRVWAVPRRPGRRREAARAASVTSADAGRLTATRCSGSMTPGPPTCTTVASLPAIHVASARDAAGRPMRTTTSGRWASANSSTRTIASNAQMVPGRCRQPDVGSASTGQPVALDSVATSSGATPLRPPARISPRSVPRRGASSSDATTATVDVTTGSDVRAGSSPAAPRNGSRNGRLRCTGPVAAASKQRRASERQLPTAAGSAMPGSWNQRTDLPNNPVWSIVWAAPTSRSSGGRSAVTTSMGTSDSPASTTAGWRFAAAVPLVHSNTAGMPASPRPRATKAALRSSWTTCTRRSPRPASARAIGVLRDPGATTAWPTPW